MSTSLKQLLAERVALEQKIIEIRIAEKSEAISKIRELLDENGLTQQDIFGSKVSGKVQKPSSNKVPAKFRDPVSGKEWSGRGLAPKWLSGKDKNDFLIA